MTNDPTRLVELFDRETLTRNGWPEELVGTRVSGVGFSGVYELVANTIALAGHEATYQFVGSDATFVVARLRNERYVVSQRIT